MDWTSREEEILLLLWRKKRPADIATDMRFGGLDCAHSR